MLRFEQHQDPNFNAKMLNYALNYRPSIVYAKREQSQIEHDAKQQKEKVALITGLVTQLTPFTRDSLSFLVIVVIACIVSLFCGCGIKGVQTLNVAN